MQVLLIVLGLAVAFYALGYKLGRSQAGPGRSCARPEKPSARPLFSPGAPALLPRLRHREGLIADALDLMAGSEDANTREAGRVLFRRLRDARAKESGAR